MNTQPLHFNPFAHLVSQEEVLDTLRRSEALASLRSKIYRPLDKPFLACFAKLAEVDAEIDAMPDDIFEDDDALDDDVVTVDTNELWG